MSQLMTRNFSDLTKIKTFEERFEYLKLNGSVGVSTFGFDRYINQMFYSSRSWKEIRDKVIIRDNGCDLGFHGYEINGKIIIHHMNPISIEDLESSSLKALDINFLICTTHLTHMAIHYGDRNLLPQNPVVRFSGDTTPWLNNNRERR